MDAAQLTVGHGVLREGVASATAERVERVECVFFGMAVGRVVNPLTAAALAAVGLEGILELRARGAG
jgi:hypothetical protein